MNSQSPPKELALPCSLMENPRMATTDKTGKLGLMGWALWRLVTAPAVWLGSAAGTAAGVQMAEQGTMGGGIGFGMLVGIGTSIVARGVHLLVHRSHADHISSEEKTATKERIALEQQTLEKLREVGLSDDASVLHKMIDARDAIVQHSLRSDVNSERSGPTLTLVSEIMRAALARVEELVDVKRRLDDPLLESPSDATKRLEGCQADLARGYRAVADARSRMLLHKELTADELLAATPSSAASGIDALAGQLEDETSILRGVERRMNQRSLDGDTHEADLGDPSRPARNQTLE